MRIQTSHWSRLIWWTFIVSAVFLLPGLDLTRAEMPPVIELGKRIYREGLNASNQPIAARALEDVPVGGAQFACANCHKRSGLGSSEGNASVPAITWDILARSIEPGKRLRHTATENTRAVRPAYTETSLRRAIVDGLSSSGSTLSPLMPRYALESDETDALVGYLKTLDSAEAPGVTAEKIHFATVITDEVSAEARTAMLKVMEAYFRDKNAGTRHEDRRVRYGPWTMENMYKGYRRWELHVWDLKGPAESWAHQMEELYQRQAVFALINGIGGSKWQPIDSFCERNSLPCLFPTTSLPPAADSDSYSIYFSRALGLEAETAAKWLRDTKASESPVLQISVAGSSGEAAAGIFAERYGKASTSEKLVSVSLPVNKRARQQAWKDAVQAAPHSTILWLDASDLDEIPSSTLKQIGQVIVSGTLLEVGPAKPNANLPAQTQILYPYVLPFAQSQALKGLEIWLKTKKVALTDPLIQANAYLALLIVNDALTHMLTYFSRDYLLETIEHKLDKLPFSGLYPRLSLGPGQRYAAKGCYVLPYSKLRTPNAQQAARWVVP